MHFHVNILKNLGNLGPILVQYFVILEEFFNWSIVVDFGLFRSILVFYGLLRSILSVL